MSDFDSDFEEAGGERMADQLPQDPMAGIQALATAILASNATLVADNRQSRSEQNLASGILPCDGFTVPGPCFSRGDSLLLKQGPGSVPWTMRHEFTQAVA